MVGFLPAPYPDECLYSILCRYYARSGSARDAVVSKTLFGNSHNSQSLMAAVYLPLRIECVDDWASPASGITRRSIATDNTLYPYWAMTYAPDVRAEVERIINGNAPTPGFYKKASCLSRRSWAKYLKYCPLCAEDDISLYGDTYWRRQHQLPEMFYCTKHKIRLLNSNISLKNAAHHFYPASSAVNTNHGADFLDNLMPYKDKLLKIGLECEWLIRHGLEVDWPANGYEKYQRLLRDIGLTSVTGITKSYSLLHTAFSDYWGKDFIDALFEETNDLHPDWWTHAFDHAYMGSFKPLYHIMFMCVLAESVSGFVDSNPADSDFGNPPYKCENHLCSHYHADGAEIVDISQHGNNITATFVCAACGMRFRIKKAKHSRGQPDIIDRGHLWLDTLVACCADKQVTDKQALKILKCSMSTFTSHKNRLGLVSHHHYNEEMGADAYYKARVTALCEEFGEVTIALLNEKVPGAYAYLGDHDYEWLQNHIVYQKDRGEYKKTEAELLRQIQDAVVKIMRRGIPKRRITVGYIEKMAGLDPGILRRQRYHSVQAYLSSVVENYDDWLRRRFIAIWKWRVDNCRPLTIKHILWDLGLDPKNHSSHQILFSTLFDELNAEYNQNNSDGADQL